MTKEEMINWINSVSYEKLLEKNIFEPVGSEWFQGEVGEHFLNVLKEKKRHLTVKERINISKNTGWE